MENYHYSLTRVSANIKTGPIATSMSDARTCPDNCSFKKTGICYASFGGVSWHWKKLSPEGGRGGSWEHFISQVKALPEGSKFRHNVAGDLAGENDEIDTAKLAELSSVVKKNKLKAWTYSHKPLNKANLKAIRSANKKGFTVNCSTDSIAAAEKSKDLNLPTVVVIPHDAQDTLFTPKGYKIVCCPAQSRENINCKKCMLCHRSDRKIIIGFKAHGSGRLKVSEIVK